MVVVVVVVVVIVVVVIADPEKYVKMFLDIKEVETIEEVETI